ncbi:MAG: hypothetical protein VB078_07930 [Clostridiaceae bacterium]|nr:hypothetical protein [Clostridiaceae bacterium]
MELTIFLKMLLDSALIITLGGYLTSLFTPISITATAALFPAVAAAVCYLLREKRGIIRYLPIAFALPSFMFADTYADYGVISVLVVYLVYITARRIYLNDDDDFKDSFQKQLALCALPCVLASLTCQFEILNKMLLPCLFIILVCGILLLRMLRHNREVIDSRSFKLFNLAAVAFLCLFTFALSSGAFLGAVGAAISFAYNKVILPLFIFFIYCMAYFLSIFGKLFALIFNKEVTFKEQENNSNLGNTNDMLYEEVEGHVPPFLIWIFFAVLAVIVGFLLYKGLKALAGKNRRFDSKSPFTMNRQTIASAKSPRRNPFAKRDESEDIRHQYRKFLRECLARGFMITPDFDSAQIGCGARDLFPGAPLEALRQLYIKARYTDREITKDEVKHAKALYSEIKNTVEIKKGEQ